MSYTIFFDSLFRTLIIAFTALGGGAFIVRVLSRRSQRIKFILLPMSLCFFIPPVAIGYGYTSLSYQLIQYPFLHEVLYTLIMVSRLIGPAAIILFFLPLSASQESRHCFKLISGGASSFKYIKYLLHASLWRYALVFSLIFLFAFSEFELASMMNIEHWSVSLFDAYAQGIAVAPALKLHLLPLIVQAFLMLILLSILEPLRNSISCSSSSVREAASPCTLRYLSVILIFAVCMLLSFLLPLFMIAASAFHGGLEVFRSLWMFKEIMNSLLIAASVTVGSYFIAIFLLRINCLKYKTVLLLIFLPALTGILPLSLVTLEIFQFPLINVLYNTPIPLVLALLLWTLPFIIILKIVLELFADNESVYSAELMLSFSGRAASEILWRLKFRRTLWICFLVFTLTYFNFTASTILAPAGMTTVTERFYNLMHYGESERLSATVCITMIIPLLLFSLISVIFKFTLKMRYRFLGDSG